MPQKKKQFRFKIPWISSGSRAAAAPAQKPKSLPPPTPLSTHTHGNPKDEPKQHPPSRPPHSQASFVAFESPAPSPSQSHRKPLRTAQTQDLSSSSSPSHAGSPFHCPSVYSKEVPVLPQPAAELSISEQENEKMNSPLKTIVKPPENETYPSEPLKVTPKELEIKKQSKTDQPEEAKQIVVMEKEPTNNVNGIKHEESSRRSRTELLHKTAPSSTGVVKTKGASTRAFRADHRKMEARESVERKMMFATSSSSAVKDEILNFVLKLATVTPTHPMDDDKNFSVVTLAGENRGATMHVGSNTAKKEGSIRIHRAYKTDPEESTYSSDANSSRRSPDEKDEVGKAYVNRNVRVSERDPGVRLVLPQQQKAEPIKKPSETRRAEVKVNRAEKTSYQPVIRRRYLRGMFLEPSDDEPDKVKRQANFKTISF